MAPPGARSLPEAGAGPDEWDAAPQPLLSSESTEWDAIPNLDDFFRRIYKCAARPALGPALRPPCRTGRLAAAAASRGSLRRACAKRAARPALGPALRPACRTGGVGRPRLLFAYPHAAPVCWAAWTPCGRVPARRSAPQAAGRAPAANLTAGRCCALTLHLHARYYEEKGFQVILVSRVLNLLALGFTVAFSAVLLLFVRWDALRARCILDDTCDISEVRRARRSRPAPLPQDVALPRLSGPEA